tara:strand:+ start:3317 stop:6436 length:3120 start_codon:yes stop_codon:yes gene_type:complete
MIDYSQYNNTNPMGKDIQACPLPTQDPNIRAKNTDQAVNIANYGASTSPTKCKGCVFYDLSKRMKSCIDEKDPAVGYCHRWQFQCLKENTCDAWDQGGPIKSDRESYEMQSQRGDSQEQGPKIPKEEIMSSITPVQEEQLPAETMSAQDYVAQAKMGGQVGNIKKKRWGGTMLKKASLGGFDNYAEDQYEAASDEFMRETGILPTHPDYDKLMQEYINNPTNNSSPNDTDSMSFSQAFAHYHKLLGPGKTFTWKNKEYSTDKKSDTVENNDDTQNNSDEEITNCLECVDGASVSKQPVNGECPEGSVPDKGQDICAENDPNNPADKTNEEVKQEDFSGKAVEQGRPEWMSPDPYHLPFLDDTNLGKALGAVHGTLYDLGLTGNNKKESETIESQKETENIENKASDDDRVTCQKCEGGAPISNLFKDACPEGWVIASDTNPCEGGDPIKDKEDSQNDSTQESTFDQAFAEAKKNGLSEFTWKGKKYHTKTKEEVSGSSRDPMDIIREGTKPAMSDAERNIQDARNIILSGDDKWWEEGNNQLSGQELFDTFPDDLNVSPFDYNQKYGGDLDEAGWGSWIKDKWDANKDTIQKYADYASYVPVIGKAAGMVSAGIDTYDAYQAYQAGDMDTYRKERNKALTTAAFSGTPGQYVKGAVKAGMKKVAPAIASKTAAHITKTGIKDATKDIAFKDDKIGTAVPDVPAVQMNLVDQKDLPAKDPSDPNFISDSQKLNITEYGGPFTSPHPLKQFVVGQEELTTADQGTETKNFQDYQNYLTNNPQIAEPMDFATWKQKRLPYSTSDVANPDIQPNDPTQIQLDPNLYDGILDGTANYYGDPFALDDPNITRGPEDPETLMNKSKTANDGLLVCQKCDNGSPINVAPVDGQCPEGSTPDDGTSNPCDGQAPQTNPEQQTTPVDEKVKEDKGDEEKEQRNFMRIPVKVAEVATSIARDLREKREEKKRKSIETKSDVVFADTIGEDYQGDTDINTGKKVGRNVQSRSGAYGTEINKYLFNQGGEANIDIATYKKLIKAGAQLDIIE